jgi:hypothetical protein
MTHTAFYAGGYSLLLVPLSKLFAYNPARLYASVIGFQAVLAGASVLLIAQLSRWLIGISRWWSLVVAFAAGCYPTFVADTGFAWAETALTFTLLLVITIAVAVLRGVERDASRSKLTILSGCLGVACGALFTMHNRTMLSIFVVIAVVGVVLLLRRHLVAALVLGASAVVVALAGDQLNQYLRRALWNGRGRIDAEAKLSALRQWARFLAGLLRLSGQSWYQVVATGSVAIIGMVGLGLITFRSTTREGSRGDRFTRDARRGGSLIVIGVFLGLLVVSAVYLAAGKRADHIVYGRYVDIATPLLIALGLAWLGTAPSRRDLLYSALGVTTVTVGLWLILDRTGRAELDRSFNSVTTFAITGWLDYHRYSPALFRATVWTLGIGLGAVAVAWVARRWPNAPWIPTAVVTVGVLALFAWQLGFVRGKLIQSLGARSPQVRALVGAIDASDVDTVRTDRTVAVVGRLHLGYWLPRVDVVTGTAKTERCSDGLTVSKAQAPAPDTTLVQRLGPYVLYRGHVPCPP